MAFLIHRHVGQQTFTSEVEGDTLRIGRGTNADLRLEGDEGVAFEHATIRRDEQGYVLVDEGSVTGTYVNGKPVESSQLTDGDRVEVGGSVLRVQLADPAGSLSLHVESLEARPPPRPEPIEAPPVEYVARYRLPRKGLSRRSLSAGSALAAGAVVAAMTMRPAAMQPGPVSQAHATLGLATDCSACHRPWRGVDLARCEACHEGTEHQPAQVFTPGCVGCHAEHRGAVALAAVADRECTVCHADLELAGGATQSVAARIARFDDHPTFSPPDDPGTLAFGHRLHLRPLSGPGGERVELQCESCHAIDPASGSVTPVTFEAHCQSCHRLHYDDRFPDLEAFHDEPDRVLAGLTFAYSRNREELQRLSQEELRRQVFGRRDSSFLPDQQTEQEALAAYDRLVRLKCASCHRLRRTAFADMTVAAVNMRPRWYERAVFSHAPHRRFACTDCHAEAGQSSATADVLVPEIDSCSPCHGGAKAAASPRDRGPTPCVTCHTYHPQEAHHIATMPPRSVDTLNPPADTLNAPVDVLKRPASLPAAGRAARRPAASVRNRRAASGGETR